MTLPQKLSALFTSALLALGIATPAGAVIVDLKAVNATAPGLDLNVDITQVDADTLRFVFTNDSTGASAGSAMTRIYFEQGLSAFSLTNGAVNAGASNGISFGTTGPGPNDPPAIGDWAGTLSVFKAAAPPPSSGVGVGDLLAIEFDYNGDFAGLVAALTDLNGTSRIAAHVQNCTGSNSCVVATVPLPASAALFAPALFGLWSLRRRGRRAAAADHEGRGQDCNG